MADKIKFAGAVLLIIAGIAGFYLLQENAMILRVGSVIAGLALGTILAGMTENGRQFYAFSQESVAETKKVVWPTRKETIQTTGVVMLFVVLMALFLWLIDAGLLWLVQILMGRAA